MATGADLIAAAVRFVGQRYSTDPGRDDPTTTWKDCSGLIAASYQVATGTRLGVNVSVTIFDLGARLGLEIPFHDAAGIAGACLLIPDDPYQGWGAAGHIGFSDGKGGTVEATPPRVQRLPIQYQPWGPRACLLPGIDYSNGGQGAVTIEEDTDMGLDIAVGQTVFGVAWAGLTNGEHRVGDTWTEDASAANGHYGIPQGALDWNAQPGRGFKYRFLDPVRLAIVLADPPAATSTPTTPGVPCPPSIHDATDEQLVAELAVRLKD